MNDNPFMDPNTTGELLTDEKKKTVVGPVPKATPPPEPNTVIDVPPPVPEVRIPEED